MSDLVDQKETLKAQVEVLSTELAKKDVNIIMLNVELAKGLRGGPDSAEVNELRKVNAQLTKEVKSLTQQLLDVHKDHSANMSKLI